MYHPAPLERRVRVGLQAGPDYHLAGGVPPGENPVVCDECWDERLR